jgi:hypothetical protein
MRGEDGHEAGEPAFDRDHVHEVSGLQAGLRPGLHDVVDLDREHPAELLDRLASERVEQPGRVMRRRGRQRHRLRRGERQHRLRLRLRPDRRGRAGERGDQRDGDGHGGRPAADDHPGMPAQHRMRRQPSHALPDG